MLKTKNLITIGILLGGALALPYFLTGPDGKPLMDMESAIDTTLSTDQTRQTYYKWQDANGVWHFGDTVPEGVKKVAVSVDTAANILSATKVPEKKKPEEQRPLKKAEAPAPGTNAILNPEKAMQAMDDAKALQGILDDRTKTINELTR